ncbi:Stk1 family PASTA domain-containing Ser/Thr kinase [Streptomyces sp. NBC_01262]|uniref:Stk1 family PASTA domain-containing Ser/Thr kinase n=1 Tax=Streptomyces sp. NBC_01262 TaxID=2903803 RepID=UPI002E35D3C5|nr:Stk1 family PASTA domain-containing Ser/Thr kinase [Streptomyces sp. NBC_01262]
MDEPRRLGGRYELGSVLGRGGMAEVYIAHDTRLGRTVAVKTLRVDLARDPSFQARFRREAQSAASLNHPSIVAVYDTGEDYVDGVSIPYIVMEYVDGSTLRELLHSGRKLLAERSLEMTSGILAALEYSHRSGIVHRDIKPANVMLTRTGQVKVMDFGIARAMGDSGMTMTQTAAVIGTAQYLSPEQAKGEQVDARSDLYSTGCLLYELLTVRPPFIGDSPVAVAYQHVREEPQPPSVYDPEVTPEMDAIVLKALTKDPDYRYQSADEMRLDIEACLDGQPVAATAAMGAVGYGGGYGGYGADAPTTALPPQQDPGTAMLPPMREDDGGYGYDERPDRRRQPKKNHTSTILLVVAGILVLVGAIFMGKALFSGNDSAGDTVTVPQFVGSTETEAKTLATNGGVTIAWGDPVACDDQKKGLVCKQSATANSEIAKDTTVTLNLSTGPTQVTVPDVTGKTEDEARSELEGKGFNVEVESKESTSDDEGTVLSQDPKGDSKAAKGATVTITVAKAPAEVTVKNVVGQDVNAAKKTLQDQGFKVVTQTQESSDVTENQVISQNPQPGTTAQVGDTVTLVIATPPTTTALPNVVGQTLANAKSALADLNLNLQVSGSNNDDAVVISTNPTAGTAVKDGDTVVITTVDSGNNNGGNNFIGGNNG